TGAGPRQGAQQIPGAGARAARTGGAAGADQEGHRHALKVAPRAVAGRAAAACYFAGGTLPVVNASFSSVRWPALSTCPGTGMPNQRSLGRKRSCTLAKVRWLSSACTKSLGAGAAVKNRSTVAAPIARLVLGSSRLANLSAVPKDFLMRAPVISTL